MVASDAAYGEPGIVVSEDQISTAPELVCCGGDEARQHLAPSMREPQITRFVRSGTLRIRQKRRLKGIPIRFRYVMRIRCRWSRDLSGQRRALGSVPCCPVECPVPDVTRYWLAAAYASSRSSTTCITGIG